MLKNIQASVVKTIPNPTLEIFRIAFGLVVFAEGTGALLMGWVKETFIDPPFNFTFIGFEWLLALKGPYMYVHYGLIALFGLGIAFGFMYRYSAVLFLIFWTVAYLMQKQHYNNHYYLMVIMGFLMSIIPAGKRFSLDVRLGWVMEEKTCPLWTIRVIQLQLAIVYFYAAIAKIYPDWLEGVPLTIWLSAIAKKHFFGSILTNKSLIIFLSYAGIFFDLFVIPALLYSKTRTLAVIASLIFHLFNSIVFQIGTFPYLMIGSLILFYPPKAIEKYFSASENSIEAEARQYKMSMPLKSILAIFFFFQALLPLRHWLYTGNVTWTEEGHRLSWRMMLRTKSGSIFFKCIDLKNGKEWYVSPGDMGLNASQVSSMAKAPDMIWQFSRYLEREYRQEGMDSLEIYAYSELMLNGRPSQPFTDIHTNLLKVEWEPFSHAQWILPFRIKNKSNP